MKILLATFWIIPHVGGVWNYMSQLKKVLESLGHEVDILGYGEGSKYVYIVNEYRKVERGLLLPLVTEKLKEHPEPMNYIDPVVKYCETERRVYELGASYLGLEQYDIIHTQDVIATACLSKVKPKGPKLVATLHGCVAHEMRLQETNSTSSMAREYFNELEHIGATSGTFTIVANEWLKNILTSEFHVPAEQIRILNYGYDTQAFLKRLHNPSPVKLQKPIERPTDKTVILYTGRLIELKGVHHLISSLSQLKKISQDWVCWIVGEGEKLRELSDQSKKLGIEEDVFFLGKRDDIAQMLTKSDIFVLPSLIENQSLSVIEAQISGKPVVVSNAGGLPEMVEHGVTGLISPVGDTQSLCENLELLIKDESYRNLLGSNAKKWGMDHWNLGNGVNKIVEVYKIALFKQDECTSTDNT